MHPFPPTLWQRIRDYLEGHKTGQIQLDVKEGRILSYRLIESGQVHDDTLDCRTNPAVQSR